MLVAVAVILSKPASAQELTGELSVVLSSGQSAVGMTDDSISTYVSLAGGSTVTLTSTQEITGFYIMWNKIPGQWSYTADGAAHTAGDKGFLHEYVALEEPALQIVLTIPEDGGEITDLYTFSAGALPDWVQVWEEPLEQADILLFSTHSDDEQLFFAGLLPHYAVYVGAAVQVVYMTQHWDSVTRPHEQLNGLWTVGIRNYPVLSSFPDDARSLGSTRESRETVLTRAQSVYSEEEWVLFQVQQLRRFQPQVVVGHDLDGEYRHGAHILNSDALMQALELSADPSYDPDSAQTYGLWDVPKTYLHLYEENQLVLDYDTPLDCFGGLTAFQMSKLGYACHDSQQWTWFTDWINVDSAAAISTYSPCLFGLYRSTVGLDSGENDLLEHITLYADQQAAQEEAERQAQEEKALRAAEEETLKKAQKEVQAQPEIARTQRQMAWLGAAGVLTAGGLLRLVCCLVVRRRKE
ncbi:MAG: PIG-L family deacetylase [Oscillospiraceae bacterium]|nr:PIG-L family deacetylase [Oscillospiraceae bacterium]